MDRIITGSLGGLIGLMSVTAAWAAADHGAADTGLPQFDPSTATEQIFWLVVLFALLYILMSRLALPRLMGVLEARQNRIDHDLEQAEKLKEEAEKTIAEFEKLMADARNKAQEIQFDARQQLVSYVAHRTAEAEAEMHKVAEEADQRIKATVQTAMTEIKTVASDAAVEITTRITGVTVPADAAAEAVETVLKEAR